jgi:hypothetical protein
MDYVVLRKMQSINQVINQSILNHMSYTLIINNLPNRTSQVIEFRNIREALNSFIERCDSLDLDYREDNNGNFIAGGIGRDWSLELLSNF